MGLQSRGSGVKDEIQGGAGVHKLLVGDRVTRLSGRAPNKLDRDPAQVGRRPLLEDSCMLIKEVERALKSGKPPRLENSRPVVKFCGIGIGGEYSNGTLKWLWQPEAWAETHSAVPDTLSHTM